MDQDQLLTTVAEILEVDADKISMSSSLEELDWDSLCQLGFIASVDEATGKEVSPDALKSCKTVADLHALV